MLKKLLAYTNKVINSTQLKDTILGNLPASSVSNIFDYLLFNVKENRSTFYNDLPLQPSFSPLSVHLFNEHFTIMKVNPQNRITGGGVRTRQVTPLSVWTKDF